MCVACLSLRSESGGDGGDRTGEPKTCARVPDGNWIRRGTCLARTSRGPRRRRRRHTRVSRLLDYDRSTTRRNNNNNNVNAITRHQHYDI